MKQDAACGSCAKLLGGDILYVVEDGIWLEVGDGARRQSELKRFE